MNISSTCNFNSMRTQMQQFRSGEKNLQKADLEQIQSQMGSSPTTGAANLFSSALESFDQIDQNKDGISADELKAFTEENGIEIPRKPSGPPPSMMMELGGAMGGKKGPPPPPQSMSKDDLLEIQSQMEQQGVEVPDELSSLISSFDTLDTNQDGEISIDELLSSQKSSEDIKSTEKDENGDENGIAELLQRFADKGKTEDDVSTKFLRAISQYANFSSNTSSNLSSSLFELSA